jgi:hypothetical protein
MIGSLALVISLGDLGWTVYTWRRGGPQLKVSVTSMALLQGSRQAWMVAVQVTNTGRAATTVTSIGFQVPKGQVLVVSAPAVTGAVRLPKRLEPGEELDYPVDPYELLAECHSGGVDYRTLKPYARSGHGTFQGEFLKVARDVLDTRAADHPLD